MTWRRCGIYDGSKDERSKEEGQLVAYRYALAPINEKVGNEDFEQCVLIQATGY